MSDQGFGQYTTPGGMGEVDDFSVNLNFGLNTTGGLAGKRPPEGRHVFEVQAAKMEFTSAGEQAVVCNMVCVGSANPEALGSSKEEWLTIPGEVRKSNNLEQWQKMMRMFRLRLEAITGRTWRDDNLNFKRSDILRRRFAATVTHSTSKSEDGEKTYINANLSDYEAIQQQGNGQQQQFGQQQAQPPAQQPPVQQPPQQEQPPQQSVPPANGPGFANFGQQPPAQPPQQDNKVYDPSEEPF